MQKPTLCIYRHVLQTGTCGYIIHPWASTTTCFRVTFLLKVPKFQKVKNKRLVNALKICLLPHPVTSMQTPQREFASAKVLLFSDICK